MENKTKEILGGLFIVNLINIQNYEPFLKETPEIQAEVKDILIKLARKMGVEQW